MTIARPRPVPPNRRSAPPLDLAEAFENHVPFVEGNPGPIVTQGQQRISIPLLEGQVDGAAPRGELEGVGQQVEDDPAIPFRIDLRRQGGRGRNPEGYGLFRGLDLEIGDDEPHEAGEIHLRVAQRQAPSLEFGDIQEVAHQTEEQPGVALDHFQFAARLAAEVRVRQPPGDGTQDQGEGGAQFMADIGEELRLELIEFEGLFVEACHLLLRGL